jgi:rhodanese-related sulfurtransferase
MNTISPEALHRLYRRGEPIRLIDVRTPAEFRACHAVYAENSPLETLDPTSVAESCGEAFSPPLYVICQKGGRGATACAKLRATGIANVVNVEGGTAAWEQAGLPVVRGQNAISLERQVRIAAGVLVLIGSALGHFVHPYFIGLAAFVGAGLTFAGITDTCGMGLVLARMPWNQVAPATQSNASAAVCCKE